MNLLTPSTVTSAVHCDGLLPLSQRVPPQVEFPPPRPPHVPHLTPHSLTGTKVDFSCLHRRAAVSTGPPREPPQRSLVTGPDTQDLETPAGYADEGPGRTWARGGSGVWDGLGWAGLEPREARSSVGVPSLSLGTKGLPAPIKT